jgi:hypothetical protein
MDFIDYPWSVINATFVKENILGSEFSFTTTTDITVTIDYIPKVQARKINTYAKEQLELLKEENIPAQPAASQGAEPFVAPHESAMDKHTEEIEEVEAEEVNDFAEIMPSTPQQPVYETPAVEEKAPLKDGDLSAMSKEQLFEKLQNYKKLLDNGLILQGEYDALKNEIIKYL